MFKMRILFVEDDERVTDAIEELCSIVNFDCDIANDGKRGLELALNGIYDVIILDIMLPDFDGLKILETIRENGIKTPVIILTAMGSVEKKVDSLDLGADDYMVKPFSVKELFARIRALNRRTEQRFPSSDITYEDLVFVNDRNCLIINGEEIRLTQKEAKILEFLLKNPGEVFSREQISLRVWGLNSEVNEKSNIDIYIHNLRRKLKDSKVKIETLRGVGYLLGSK